MKAGNVPGFDGFPLEHWHEGCMTMLEWLVILLNECFDMEAEPVYWHGHECK